MTRYEVPAKRFFGDSDSDFPEFFGAALLRDRDKCRSTMQQLILRYQLGGKSILSVGAGQGYEEYWLHRAGCSITIVDIDEYKSIEPSLRAWSSRPSSEPTMTFIVADAMEYLSDNDSRFDVVYFSGFTPAESLRGEVQQQYAGKLQRRIQLRLAAAMRGSAATWPPKATPFGPYETAAMRNRLRDGGLFLSQSYYRGVPLHQNPHYLDCMRSQLRSLELELITYYTFPYPYTDVGLAVALKGTNAAAQRYCDAIASMPEIDRFQGRSDVATGIVIHRFHERSPETRTPEVERANESR